MNSILPMKGDAESVIERKLAELRKMADAFSAEKIEELEKYIVDFPQDEGFAETAKRDALYSIAIAFIDWILGQQK